MPILVKIHPLENFVRSLRFVLNGDRVEGNGRWKLKASGAL